MILMVALSAHQDVLVRHRPVEELIKGVHVRGPMTACSIKLTFTAVKPPAV